MTQNPESELPKNGHYLTIHGHFYQPPRENPWLEAIEQQDSALPFHDWNERINLECYNPNSASRIVDNKNKILDIVSNYSLMSFNFGPTLMSWMEQFAPSTYERVIKADVLSIDKFSGHGNAIAQVYNHMIMPLANKKDKETQVIWGIKDFKFRFGRDPEGMWLAETAVDDETLSVLADHGIKYTILSPFQALSSRKIGDRDWHDNSWGNVDPAKPYRYFIKSNPKKYVDLFFYDGAISRSVAFDNILKDGNIFAKRLKDGLSDSRGYPQLVNIATDGESYGHHTKFGDMALSYVLRVKAKDEGFTLTNYGEYLEKFGVQYEAEIKQASSWSCFHGVGRWKEDCGCSTGAQQGWNQKWRKPLREAFDYLRDELIKLYKKEGVKYFSKDVWEVRNEYIDVILDRSELSVKNFQKSVMNPGLNDDEIASAMKLLEIQRQAMLMYTSCGWFFADISGIETTQILKYAARAMQLASSFTKKNFETEFLNILDQAESNIKKYGTGKDIYEEFVKPAVVTIKQIVSLYAISALYEDLGDETTFYSYKITRMHNKVASSGKNNLSVGRIEVQSKITLEKFDMMYVLLKFSGEDFHCAIKECPNEDYYDQIQEELIDIFTNNPLTEIIRHLDDTFGCEYYTLKNIFIEERRKILKLLLHNKTNKFTTLYKEIYDEGKGSIYHFKSLGLEAPNEFKIATAYTLSREFNLLMDSFEKYLLPNDIQMAIDINNEANNIGIKLDKKIANNVFAQKIDNAVFELAKSPEIHRIEIILDLFKCIELLDLNVDISEAQDTYYQKVKSLLEEFSEQPADSHDDYDRRFVLLLLDLGDKLNFNTNFFKENFDKIMLPATKAE